MVKRGRKKSGSEKSEGTKSSKSDLPLKKAKKEDSLPVKKSKAKKSKAKKEVKELETPVTDDLLKETGVENRSGDASASKAGESLSEKFALDDLLDDDGLEGEDENTRAPLANEVTDNRDIKPAAEESELLKEEPGEIAVGASELQVQTEEIIPDVEPQIKQEEIAEIPLEPAREAEPSVGEIKQEMEQEIEKGLEEEVELFEEKVDEMLEDELKPAVSKGQIEAQVDEVAAVQVEEVEPRVEALALVEEGAGLEEDEPRVEVLALVEEGAGLEEVEPRVEALALVEEGAGLEEDEPRVEALALVEEGTGLEEVEPRVEALALVEEDTGLEGVEPRVEEVAELFAEDLEPQAVEVKELVCEEVEPQASEVKELVCEEIKPQVEEVEELFAEEVEPQVKEVLEGNEVESLIEEFEEVEAADSPAGDLDLIEKVEIIEKPDREHSIAGALLKQENKEEEISLRERPGELQQGDEKIELENKYTLENMLQEEGRKERENMDVMVKSEPVAEVAGKSVKDLLLAEKPRLVIDNEKYVRHLWDSNPDLYEILKETPDLDEARDKIYSYLDQCERKLFDSDNDLHVMEKSTIREGIQAFRTIIAPVYEDKTEVSALEYLWKLSSNEQDFQEISPGFILEFVHLFRAVSGNSNIYRDSQVKDEEISEFLKLKGRNAARHRSDDLEDVSFMMKKYFKKYPSGLEDDVIAWRKTNVRRVLEYFKGSKEDWEDYHWHLEHVIKDLRILSEIIELTAEQKEAARLAEQNKLPVGVTPYYLSLMDRKLSIGHDHAIRSQVIPMLEYVEKMAHHKEDREHALDFMGEHDTSPIDLITRRYPMISIMKPYNTCPQICVYCQRNWEIEECLDPDARPLESDIDAAMEWLDENPGVGEVLITGGDPMVLSDEEIDELLSRLAAKKHIYRIRFATRTPVTLPMRWTENLTDILAKYIESGTREICVVTHFEHPYEITPRSAEAIQHIRQRGMGVYNQQVFTVENSRRFETCKLRHDLRLIGVDPYYTFNMKGKEETKHYMVPIARILQERKEEARLLPGISRTDEPVFNVPRLGKNHLQAGQDHKLVMIRPDGSRVYEMHPWEKNIKAFQPYYYNDKPIYDYLQDLATMGENLSDYKNIWYYY